MAKQQTITSLPRSPQDDRHGRMIKYTIAMTIRLLCIIACLFVRDWWLLIPAAGAVILPYFAVVIANVGSSGNSEEVLRPGAIVPVAPPVQHDAGAPEGGAPEHEPRREAPQEDTQ